MIAKIAATIIVMVYNFVTRKLILEKNRGVDGMGDGMKKTYKYMLGIVSAFV